MKKLILALMILGLAVSPCHAASQFDVAEPDNAQGISSFPAVQRVNNEAFNRILIDYQEGAEVIYSSATEVIVSAGSVVCRSSDTADTGVRRLRTNTSTTTVGWANIDTGAEAGSTTYYVYARADTDATTFTVLISTSSSAPTGATYYKKLGSFYNNASSDIDRAKVYTNAYGSTVNDSSGAPFWAGVYDYSTSTSSSTYRNSAMKIAYGVATMSSGTVTISSLPFTDTPSCVPQRNGVASQSVYVSSASSSSVTFADTLGGSAVVHWICIGE